MKKMRGGVFSKKYLGGERVSQGEIK